MKVKSLRVLRSINWTYSEVHVDSFAELAPMNTMTSRPSLGCSDTPLKIGGLEDHFPFQMRDGCRFQPSLFQGNLLFVLFLYGAFLSKVSTK